MGESGMQQKKVVVGFKRLPPASGVVEGLNLKQEIYCSTVTSNVASSFESSIETPVI
jgi:hypothetical protein